MANILNSKRVEVAFAVGQMVNSVKHIGLANAVSANEAIDFGVKLKSGIRKVLIIKKRNLF
jgi:hypothetical protein